MLGITPDAEYPLDLSLKRGMTTVIGGKRTSPQHREGSGSWKFTGRNCRKHRAAPLQDSCLEGERELADHPGVIGRASGDGKTVIEAEGSQRARQQAGARGERGREAAGLQSVGLGIGGDFQKLADFVCTEKIGTETNGETLGICFRDEETGETNGQSRSQSNIQRRR